jgi:hypothetical protein
MTTITWRLAQIIVGSFAACNGSHFGGRDLGDPESECWRTVIYAGTAELALEQLDETYAVWIAGVRGFGAERVAQLGGPAEGPYGDRAIAELLRVIAELLLHINREVIHHGAGSPCCATYTSTGTGRSERLAITPIVRRPAWCDWPTATSISLLEGEPNVPSLWPDGRWLVAAFEFASASSARSTGSPGST